jgi:hypothetical protein
LGDLSAQRLGGDVVLEVVSAYGLGALIASCVALLLVRHYLPGYLAEKGKNLATREDIGAITDKVEEVKIQYSAILEEIKARHQLRTAALDARLKAHQEAFVLWRKLVAAAYTDQLGKVVIECQSFWEANCLYLEPAVRDAFMEAYSGAHTHGELHRVRADAPLVSEQWSRVTAFPPILFRAIQLPGISELEATKTISGP